MTRKIQLKFSHRYRSPILGGDKTATIRYGFDRPADPGVHINMRTPGGDHFATGHVNRVDRMTAFDAAAIDIDGHRNYRDVWDLLDHLEQFYPDANLTPKSDLIVLSWNEAHPPGEKRFCRTCREGPMVRRDNGE